MMANANAQHLKRNLPIKTKLMNWIWDNIINTKRGWHEYVQEEIDEIINFLLKANVKYVLTNNFSLKRMEFENKEFDNTPEESGVWWPGHWDGKTKDVRNMPINLELHPKWKWKAIESDEEFHFTDTEGGQLPQGNECLDLYKINE